MNKQQFLNALEGQLCGLPREDAQKTLDFYAEMIDDRIDEGLSEEDAVAAIGNIQDIANEILMDVPLLKLVKEKAKPNRTLRVWEIVLLVLGSPIWLSLLIAAIAIVLSVYVSLWSVVVSLWACEAAFCGSAFGGVAASIVLFANGQNAFAGVAMLGISIFLIGFSILFFYVCKASTKGMVWITKKITLCIKYSFLRKGKAR